MSNTRWSAAQIDRLTKLAAAGASGTEIGGAVGKSRNALNHQSENGCPSADVSIFIGEIEGRDLLRVSIDLCGGWLINFRRWFVASAGEYRPARQGIAIKAGDLPHLSRLVTVALAEARARSLIPDEDRHGA